MHSNMSNFRQKKRPEGKNFVIINFKNDDIFQQ